MKTLQTVGKSLLVASLIFLASCNKDDDAPAIYNPVAPANASYVTAKVDGADFSTLVFGTSTASCSRSGSGSNNQITILGADLSANSITIALFGVTATGTYTVNNTTDSVLNYSPGSGEIAYTTGICQAGTGTIIVTALDETHIEGTFSFTGKDGENCGDNGGIKTVTQGVFKGVFPNN